jgi:hypothetical protein
MPREPLLYWNRVRSILIAEARQDSKQHTGCEERHARTAVLPTLPLLKSILFPMRNLPAMLPVRDQRLLDIESAPHGRMTRKMRDPGRRRATRRVGADRLDRSLQEPPAEAGARVRVRLGVPREKGAPPPVPARPCLRSGSMICSCFTFARQIFIWFQGD